MNKRNKIIYWIATIWLGFGMLSTGIVQVILLDEEVQKMTQLGYPPSFIQLLGIWKILGVAAILSPGRPLLKEWAYAGFFFTVTGALYAHVTAGDPATEYIGAGLLLILTILSWYLRPYNRRLLPSPGSKMKNTRFL